MSPLRTQAVNPNQATPIRAITAAAAAYDRLVPSAIDAPARRLYTPRRLPALLGLQALTSGGSRKRVVDGHGDQDRQAPQTAALQSRPTRGTARRSAASSTTWTPALSRGSAPS
jgi:hypothetical protein